MTNQPLAAFVLPKPNHTIDAVGDNGEDAASPGWSDSRGGVWIAWTNGVTDPDGDYFEEIEDVRRDALAMLAAVRQVELWRAEREENAS